VILQCVSEWQPNKVVWSKKNADSSTLIGCHGNVPRKIKKAQWGEQALTPVYQSWNSPDLTRSTTMYGISCRYEFTRLQCVTQLTSSGASLRLGWAFCRQSSTKPLTSGGYNYEPASKQRDVTSSTRWHYNQRLFSEPPHFIEENSYA